MGARAGSYKSYYPAGRKYCIIKSTLTRCVYMQLVGVLSIDFFKGKYLYISKEVCMYVCVYIYIYIYIYIYM
uniref:Uncharacterized protein n=1 Tax=Octopus bimaculoides TaxID=37653 RepID=A0A0L8I6A0_OCTBM